MMLCCYDAMMLWYVCAALKVMLPHTVLMWKHSLCILVLYSLYVQVLYSHVYWYCTHMYTGTALTVVEGACGDGRCAGGSHQLE
jgi:hypothetical protein